MIDGKILLENEKYAESLKKIVSLPLPWEKLRGKKILIGGATGLIGSFFVDALMTAQKILDIPFTVYALGRNGKNLDERYSAYKKNGNLRTFVQDITKPLSCELEESGADYIFHLASNTHPISYTTEPISTITTNILGTNNLLDFAARHKTERFVFSSSVEIYGENRGDTEKFSERYCGYINCNTLRAGYPEGKRAGEALCQAYRAEKNLDVVIPRFCRVYGETMLMSDTKALSQFIKNALRKENIILKSAGKQFYSYLHVSDAVSALLYVFFLGKNGEAYNISEEKSDVTLKELAELLANIAGTKVVYEIPSLAEKSGYSTATKALLDSSKLKSLAWKARFDIQSGLKQTLDILEGMF